MLKIGQNWDKIANYPPQCSTKIGTPVCVIPFSLLLMNRTYIYCVYQAFISLFSYGAASSVLLFCGLVAVLKAIPTMLIADPEFCQIEVWPDRKCLFKPTSSIFQSLLLY